MGGSGSGRIGFRTVVEDCTSIDIDRWRRDGVIDHGLHTFGARQWGDGQGNVSASISYEVYASAQDPWVRLSYSFPERGYKMDYKVLRLTTSIQPFGGFRWWFLCPLTVNGKECGRRVRKLYLPPGGKFFGCRHCYNLTYTSSNQSHMYDNLCFRLAGETGLDPNFIKSTFRK